MSSRLGYWLLERFDAETGILNVFDKSIQVIPELVQQTFGLPMGIYKVELCDVLKERANTVYKDWKKQFGGKTRIKTGDLVELIKKQIRKNDAERKFQMNFLVLFATVLGRVSSMGTVNLRFIPSLHSLENVKEMNWCQYLLNYLKSSKINWSGGKKHFYGPLLLLELIFANSVLKNPKIPAFEYWKTDKITELDEMMFGKERKRKVEEEDEEDDVEEEEIHDVPEVEEEVIQNVPEQSNKPKFTRKLIQKLRTPEKENDKAIETEMNDGQQGLQMMEERHLVDELNQQMLAVIPDEEDNILIKKN
ncbi:ulp1 protease family, C-terminal catalytic domain-containing protein [Artemisia annua]|uniref:Ulp1 protease family, C-terminal catalytic domain-containing protein n=1 Tax=Artemisia annua TaxID=35608 RepID=A0A2U1MWP4_ARTAN|nr:ulp1 protease family, C-terminal catalytic domain-containing protein [Artemisia annua]